MNQVKINTITANMTEESYQKLNPVNLANWMNAVTYSDMPIVYKKVQMLAGASVIQPTKLGFPATLKCLRKALQYVN